MNNICRNGHQVSICGRVTGSGHCRDCSKMAQKRFRDNLKARCFEKLGNRCVSPHCLVPGGCTDVDVLQIDHVNDDGAEERRNTGRERGHQHTLWRLVMADEKGRYQLLCANCNMKKEIVRRRGA